VDYLAEELGKHPGEILLAALGPLTNLANLMTRYPGSLEQAAGLVVMGGAVDVPGNVTGHAEFNFYSDPEAARMVLSSGIPLTLVDLAATRQVGIDREEAVGLRPQNRLGVLAVQMLNNWFRRDAGRQRFYFHDPLVMAIAITPGIAATESSQVVVETYDPVRLGESKVSGRPGPVEVIGRVDRGNFFGLFEQFLGAKQATSLT